MTMPFLWGKRRSNCILEKEAAWKADVLVKKEDYEDLGLSFGEGIGAPARCRNKCLFCFIDQLPGGMRRSLYVKGR